MFKSISNGFLNLLKKKMCMLILSKIRSISIGNLNGKCSMKMENSGTGWSMNLGKSKKGRCGVRLISLNLKCSSGKLEYGNDED